LTMSNRKMSMQMISNSHICGVSKNRLTASDTFGWEMAQFQ